MERRGFLSKLGLLTGAAIVAPKILQGIEIKPEPKPEVRIVNDSAVMVVDNILPQTEDEKLTSAFFKYLKEKADFEWVRVTCPLYQKPNGQFIKIPMYSTPAVYYPFWKDSVVTITENLNIFGMNYPQTEEEYWNQFIFPEVCVMINKTRARHIKDGYTDPSYLMSLHFTPILYDPKDFSPQRRILLRGQI